MISALTLMPYTSSLNPYASSRRSSRAARPKATMQDYSGAYFLSWLKENAEKDYGAAEVSEQKAKEQEEYDKYIAPVLSNPRTYYFPKDAKAEDYIKAAFKITNKMKSIGPSMNSRGASSSVETKKQLYSIIEQFIKKYPDQNNELKMYGILNDYGNIDGTYSEEDKKFIDYLKRECSGGGRTL